MASMEENKGAQPAGSRGFGRTGGAKRPPRREAPKDKEWTPLTKLGRLVKAGKIKRLEEIYLHSLPIKEPEIIDYFLGDKIKEELMKIKPVQKMTMAGQRSRFQACVAVGDGNGHVGYGLKVGKEAAGAIRGAVTKAKLSLIPVRRGYWGNKIGNPHTVAMKVTGKCGSVRMRLVPAPRGTGIVAPPVAKKLIQLAGVNDCYSSTSGATKTTPNFVRATYNALAETYNFLTPDLWAPGSDLKTPFEEHQDFLRAETEKIEA